jgi:hypothetical protein
MYWDERALSNLGMGETDYDTRSTWYTSGGEGEAKLPFSTGSGERLAGWTGVQLPSFSPGGISDLSESGRMQPWALTRFACTKPLNIRSTHEFEFRKWHGHSDGGWPQYESSHKRCLATRRSMR